MLEGYETDGFYWGRTAASHSIGNEGRGKNRTRVVGQREGTRYILATDGVHVEKDEINLNYRTAHDITGDHTNLLLVVSKEIRTARPQQMMAPSALWGIATLSVFRWRTTVYASVCRVLYSCTSRVQAGPSKPEVRYGIEHSNKPLTQKGG